MLGSVVTVMVVLGQVLSVRPPKGRVDQILADKNWMT